MRENGDGETGILGASVSSSVEESTSRALSMRDPVALMSPGERNSKRRRKCLHALRHVSPPPAAISPCPTLRKIPAATPREPVHVREKRGNERSYTLGMTRHSETYENTGKTISFRTYKLYTEMQEDFRDCQQFSNFISSFSSLFYFFKLSPFVTGKSELLKCAPKI